jgi:hypothetical protein
MGGYAIDISTGDPFLPSSIKRLTLTPEGLRFLRKYAPEAIPYVSEEEITDKSKADGLAKLLVSLQAAWFCMQCITRAVQHLPISLLEITTAGHALYTLLTYILWAQKPMNISRPTLIAARDEKLRRILAYMFMCSPLSGQALGKVGGNKRMYEFEWIEKHSVASQFVATATPFTLRRGTSLPGTGFFFLSAHHNQTRPRSSFLPTYQKKLHLGKITLNSIDMKRWRLAWEALLQHKGLQSEWQTAQADDWRHQNFQSDSGTRTMEADGSPKIRMVATYVVLRASNVPGLESWEYPTWPMILAFTVAEGAYAIVHALGWNSTFASFPRQLVWRIASCVIGGGGLFLGGWLTCVTVEAMMPSMVMLGVIEFGLRMFLLIEAVLNIAVLPDGVYQSPNWPDFIPHWA